MKKMQEKPKRPLGRPPMKPFTKIVAFIPLVISVSWMLYLNHFSKVPLPSGELLAPASAKPLFIALLIFSLGYAGFLLLMFSDDIKEFFGRAQRE